MRSLLRRGLRRRLVALVGAGATASVALLLVAFNLVLDARLRADTDALLRQRATASLATLTTVDGRLSVSEAPDQAAVDTQTWVFAGSRELEQPRVPSDVESAARALQAAPRGYRELARRELRLYSVPVRVGQRRLGTLVVSVSTAPARRGARTALVASLALGALSVILMTLGAWWLVGRALRPVARMTTDAAEWGERDLDRRFSAPEFEDELGALARTFNALLDRVASSLRSEQRLTAEISHELRTPLSRVIAEADLALSRPRTPEQYRGALTAVRAGAEALERALDALLAGARGQRSEAVADVGTVLARVAAACREQAAERGLQLVVNPTSSDVQVAGASSLAERALHPLVVNACQHARSRVELDACRIDSRIVFTVTDDGRGVPPGEAEAIFTPGVRGNTSPAEGSGLGLALARRLAHAAGGEVICRSPSVGAKFELDLPAS
ncbi:MAG TPA: HAMP domain-containing sensor histidine kinase [Solirubrobacteraceae bacterium]|jgi:signal transduction histidine kinase|nr:HAMP domain-containing sensor histidine kinase [Solirubrobacteraceae bacterium]